MEIRPIPGYPGYFATDDGDILSARKCHGHHLQRTGELYKKQTRIQNSGYKYVSLTVGKRSVHRLVCAAFHGIPPAHYECRHKNGKKLDNRVKNLRWGTSVQNQINDKIRHGQIKLSPSKVCRMRRQMIAGVSLSALAAEYRVSYHTAYYIRRGDTWRGRGCGMNERFRRWLDRTT